MRNLNIKSDEAYELAHFIAKRTGQSVTQAVIEILKREKRALTADELIAKWTAIGGANRDRLDPAFINWNYADDLYDENGLPK